MTSALQVAERPDAPVAEPVVGQTDAGTGLTGAEVAARRAQGLGNRIDAATSRGYGQILRANFLTFLNVTLFGVGIVLVVLGLPRDAILTSGFAILNAAIGVVQEVLAKRRLDRIALLSRVQVSVVRDGVEHDVDPAALVVGDILTLRTGDQAMLDGVLAGDGTVEMDESLLTGESEAVHKETGDPVYAGSYCVAGTGRYQATKVSAESVASGIAADARAFRVVLTPLQREVNAIIRLLILVASTMLAMLILSSLVWNFPLKATVVASSVVLGIVPTGLFLMITITYSMASLRIAGRNALVQQVNAVESLSNVDVFCMDKTGTLTSNALSLAHVRPLAGSEDEARQVLGAVAHSAQSRNTTTEAIAQGCDGPAVPLVDEIPFSSARKWSAVAADDDALRGACALGAPEMLDRLLARSAGPPPHEWTAQGLRVLLAAFSPTPNALHDADGQATLPDDMAPLAWIALADELRPDSREAIAGFQDAGIALKIISGDNPETVAALARQAGLAGDATLISGVELAEMDDAELEDAAVRGTVFGRTTPDQKSRLVRALKRRGYYVAMTGDGVNDVPSLKQADLGIAMESGSQATRMVADIVLLGDSFGALPAAFTEGQRVRRGLQDVMGLFLTRVTVVAMALMLCAVVRIGFPFSPGNLTLLTVLTVGIPTFGLALWARPGAPPRSMTRALGSFVLPAAISLAFAAFAVYVAYFLLYDFDLADLRSAEGGDLMSSDPVARDALTYLLILAGLALVPFASPPTDWWSVLGEKERDWRPTLLAVAMLPLYAVVLAVEPLRAFFGTRILSPGQYVVIALVVAVWVVGLRHAYRTRLVDRFLGIV